jgi:hypothetical protein
MSFAPKSLYSASNPLELNHYGENYLAEKF